MRHELILCILTIQKTLNLITFLNNIINLLKNNTKKFELLKQ